MNSRYGILSLFVRTAAFSLALLTALCCTKPEKPTRPDDGFDPNFKLLFAVPVETKSSSNMDYSDPMNNEGTDNLLRADDLEIYFFDIQGSYVSSVKDILNLRLSEDTGAPADDRYHLYYVEMHVENIVNGGVYRVVVVANRRSHLSGALPFCTPDNDNWLETGTGSTDEEKLYSTLKFNYSSTGTAGFTRYLSRNFTRDEIAYVPMWGFKQLVAHTRISADGFPDELPLSGTIDIMRSIAKVKVSIEESLFEGLNLTQFNALTSKGGIRLYSPVTEGWMAPSYEKVKYPVQSTPEILNKDRVGGTSTGAFTNEWINKGASAEDCSVYPMYRHTDGSFYAYLPENHIGESWIGLEFEWYDPDVITENGTGFIRKDFRLEFAEYSNTESTSEGNQIDKFPVMRNHYYIYTVTRLNPLIIKYEVCDWNYKQTEFEFN